MYQESQVVLIDSEGVYGIVVEVLAYDCKVVYSVGGFEYEEYFEKDDLTVIGQIRFEEE